MNYTTGKTKPFSFWHWIKITTSARPQGTPNCRRRWRWRIRADPSDRNTYIAFTVQRNENQRDSSRLILIQVFRKKVHNLHAMGTPYVGVLVSHLHAPFSRSRWLTTAQVLRRVWPSVICHQQLLRNLRSCSEGYEIAKWLFLEAAYGTSGKWMDCLEERAQPVLT